MKLFRALNSSFNSGDPFIQWAGDVRGIIAASRAADRATISAPVRVSARSGFHPPPGSLRRPEERRPKLRVIARAKMKEAT